MKKDYVGMNAVGQFEVVSNAVEITDPCYAPNDGVVVKNVKNGTYLCYTEVIDEGAWGGRNAVLYVLNKEILHSINQNPNYPLPPEYFETMNWEIQKEGFGVDSGQAGIFDIANYKGGADDTFYENCNSLTLDGLEAGTIEGGVVCSSGFGDGGYGFETVSSGSNNEIWGFKVIFIDENELEVDDMGDENDY